MASTHFGVALIVGGFIATTVSLAVVTAWALNRLATRITEVQR